MKNRPSDKAVSAWARLLRAEALLMTRVQEALKAEELPPLSWYDVLLELHRSRSGLRQFEIGEKILLPKHNLSRLIDRLQQSALVERVSCPEDGRGNVVRITAEGARLLKRMWPTYGEVIHRQLDSRLTPAELATLGDLLNKLVREED